ncbi:Uncharacterised protein [Vibrio cholerae]|nr:Uncharacterised protein [Vibrio cholerae]
MIFCSCWYVSRNTSPSEAKSWRGAAIAPRIGNAPVSLT